MWVPCRSRTGSRCVTNPPRITRRGSADAVPCCGAARSLPRVWPWLSEPVVLPGPLGGVDPGGWDQRGVAVRGEDDRPAFGVDLAVPQQAEQRAVVDVGGA